MYIHVTHYVLGRHVIMNSLPLTSHVCPKYSLETRLEIVEDWGKFREPLNNLLRPRPPCFDFAYISKSEIWNFPNSPDSAPCSVCFYHIDMHTVPVDEQSRRVVLYRGGKLEHEKSNDAMLKSHFPRCNIYIRLPQAHVWAAGATESS